MRKPIAARHAFLSHRVADGRKPPARPAAIRPSIKPIGRVAAKHKKPQVTKKQGPPRIAGGDLSHDEICRMVNKPDPVILEIGSNDGTDTLEFLKRFPGAQIFCFEPEPRAIAKWKVNVTDQRARLFEVALDTKDGEQLFHRSGGSPRPGVTDWDMSGSLCQPTGHLTYSPWCKFEETLPVKTTSLDAWWVEKGSPLVDFIWMDVQGAEYRVLTGGQKALQRTRYIKLECHKQILYAGQRSEEELKQLLTGWKCQGRYGADLLFKNERL